MRPIAINARKFTIIKRCCTIFLILLLSAGPAFAEKFTFAVIADNLKAFSSYRNVLEEIRDLKVNADRRFPPVEFILACGDIAPADKNYEIYWEVFRGKGPPFFPVRGNHEKPRDVNFILTELLPSVGNRIRVHDQTGVNYYLDWKNIRVIVLDQYSTFGKTFDNPKALKWIEDAISSAGNANHVFLAFHEPHLPEAPLSDPFWKVLLRHKDKVRGVLVGHTHIYFSRPFPDNEDRIHYVNVGNAGASGHSDQRQTIVEVMVDGEDITFRAVQAPDGTKRFELREEWSISRGINR